MLRRRNRSPQAHYHWPLVGGFIWVMSAVVVFVTIAVFVWFLLLLAASRARSHDHWINNGRYLDPATGVHCCTPDLPHGDCHKISDLATIRFNGDGTVTINGFTFRKDQIHNSEDAFWWRCGPRCIFRPGQV